MGFPSDKKPYTWWQNNKDIAIPSGVWTPLAWNGSGGSDPYNVRPDLSTFATTTIAAASNLDVLPQATINVADTTGFDDDGYLLINGPPGTDDETIVTYTGKTATSFTGCNSAYRATGVGISTGTLATGQAVRQAFVEFVFPPTFYLWQVVGDICMEAIPTSSVVAVRFRTIGAFALPIFTNTQTGANLSGGSGGSLTRGQHIQITGQPGVHFPDDLSRIEVQHNSGAPKLSKVDSIQAPSLMQAFLAPFV